MNFFNTLFVISAVDCGEFHQRLRSEKIGLGIAVNFHNTLLVISTVNCGELLLHTLCNFDGRLR